MHKNKHGGGISIDKLKDSLTAPFGTGSDGLDIEIISDKYVNIDGCTKIKEYTDTVAVFAGKNMTAVVKGDKIELFAFADGRIRASGKISMVELNRGE